MDSDRWERAQKLFAAALEQAPEARDAYLGHACSDDPELVEEVRALLRADSEAHSFLDVGAVEVAGDLGVLGDSDRVGTRIGPWRLTGRIGRGGMGAVYLAERADGEFEQRVALKLIKRGMDSEEILGRFRAERQILAGLDHPNIARFLDGGITEDGLPWFTMEYVDGVPIDRYCDEHHLPVDARLDLFRATCCAVDFAQRNLVVHRDLKPSNILVTAAGAVKLLDFGIAKLLHDGAELAPAVTRTGHRVMTPGYAAPEQVRGEPVTTATDVYSLGILLYELLTGQRPYAPDDDTPGALEHAICEATPPKPSTAVTRPGPPARPSTDSKGPTSPATVGTARATRPKQLRRKLAGDLDNICLMALRKERERRYGSAGQLLEDIERYRGGLPVSARSDTLSYRARKFVLRNRAGVATAAVFLVAVISLVSFYTQRLAQERDHARLEAEKARSVSGFLTGLFEVADPSESLGETITARELLDRGAKRIRKELAGQPEVQATMMDVVGTVYHNLGLYDDADSLLATALDIRRGADDPDDDELAASLEHLAELRITQGGFAEAESMLLRALDIRTRLHGPRHELVAETLYDLSWTYAESGRPGDAEPRLREAIDIWTGLGKERDPAALSAMADLALLENEKGDQEEAEPLFRRTIALQREVLGDHPDLSSTLYNFSEMLRMVDRLDESEAALREALAIDVRVFGPDHPNVSYDRIALARIDKVRYDFDAAEELFREALASRTRYYGKEHPQVARSIADLAGIRFSKGAYAEAESLWAASLAMQERVNGPEHPVNADRLRDLGRVAGARGDYDRAVTYHRRAVALREKIWGKRNPKVAETMMYLARALSDAGDTEEALRIQREALRITAEARGDTHREYVYQLGSLAKLLAAANRADEAEPYFREALEKRTETYGANHPLVADVQTAYGKMLRDSGRAAEAEPLLRAALATRRAMLPPGSRATAGTMLELGGLLAEQGRTDEAAPLLEESVAALRKLLPADHPQLIRTRAMLERLPKRDGSP